MSVVSENARLNLQLADFAQNVGGKTNILGGNIQLLGFDPAKRTTARFALVAQVELDSLFCPADFTVEISLLDVDGQPVPLPAGAAMAEGTAPKFFRISQPARIERPAVPRMAALPPSIPGNVGIVIDFGNGIPITPGAAYAWQLRIDEDDANAIRRPLFVPGAPPKPVFG
ncbi:MAG: hypothetical protein FWD83_03145 [Promicromonosporaceae bacterium]|nr:hypothetical protein [Promicromonosporaceae bacterium]